MKTYRDQGISHPLVPKGEFMGHPLRKPLSRPNFVMNNTLYIYTQKQTNKHVQVKKYKNTILKWRPNHRFWFCAINFGVNLKNKTKQNKTKKNTFPKEFFCEIWFIIGDYEYIIIAEIKSEFFFILVGF